MKKSAFTTVAICTRTHCALWALAAALKPSRLESSRHNLWHSLFECHRSGFLGYFLAIKGISRCVLSRLAYRTINNVLHCLSAWFSAGQISPFSDRPLNIVPKRIRLSTPNSGLAYQAPTSDKLWQNTDMLRVHSHSETNNGGKRLTPLFLHSCGRFLTNYVG